MKNIKEEIQKLKEQKNAVILAHFYQVPEIQEVADYVGDSLHLSQMASKTDADIIVFAGVYFMGETAKILNPGKKVIVPDLEAGCSLVESCPTVDFERFIQSYPNAEVVTYINSSAKIKAMSDYVCTSSNAVTIINSIPKDKEIIFAPDKNLGRFLQKSCDRKLILWDGVCTVHEEFSASGIEKAKSRLPGCKVIAHPECSSYSLKYADFIGSTKALLNFVKEDDAPSYIVATESGILYEMKLQNPTKHFEVAPAVNTCMACQVCPYMKMNTIGKLYDCLLNEFPEVTINESERAEAYKPIAKMLSLSI